MIDIVMRQTEYNREKSIEMLKKHKGDVNKVIKEYLGIDLNPVKEESKKSTNQKIYNMLQTYCNKYKEYGVLQTSFNIHGEPIVNSASDAFSTLQRSGLRHLILENFLISKKKV